MGLSVVIASVSQILLKKSAKKHYDSVIKEYLNVYVILGYALLAVSTVFTIMALKGMEYKNAPVIESLGFILVLILSRIVFGEKITKRKIIGNAMILIGVFVFYI
jgi:drug/metabolite transporter (DMT)-like permease